MQAPNHTPGMGTVFYLAPVLFTGIAFLFSLIASKASTVWVRWLFRVVAAVSLVAMLFFGFQLVRLNMAPHP